MVRGSFGTPWILPKRDPGELPRLPHRQGAGRDGLPVDERMASRCGAQRGARGRPGCPSPTPSWLLATAQRTLPAAHRERRIRFGASRIANRRPLPGFRPGAAWGGPYRGPGTVRGLFFPPGPHPPAVRPAGDLTSGRSGNWHGGLPVARPAPSRPRRTHRPPQTPRPRRPRPDPRPASTVRTRSGRPKSRALPRAKQRSRRHHPGKPRPDRP